MGTAFVDAAVIDMFSKTFLNGMDPRAPAIFHWMPG